MAKASSGTSWKSCTCGCQAWSDQGERILVRVESVDKVDRSTLAVACNEADFATFETALYQVLHRTSTYEPLMMVQQVRRKMIRETRQTEAPACAAMISNSANVIVQKTWRNSMASSATSSTRRTSTKDGLGILETKRRSGCEK